MGPTTYQQFYTTGDKFKLHKPDLISTQNCVYGSVLEDVCTINKYTVNKNLSKIYCLRGKSD